jgi:NAD-dependent deacetylase
MSESVDAVRGWIDSSARIVALTGAGISTESGIPDFRGPQGLWTRNPKAERLSNIRDYMSDPEVRRLSWQSRVDHPAWHAEPNAGHRALVRLEHRGKLHALVTQNIDGLHQRAGTAPDRVIEVHGTVHEAVCMRCGWRGPMLPVLGRVRAGEDDPPCAACGGIAVPAAKAAGARLVIINAEPTPFDELADAVLSKPIGEVLPVLCEPV